MTDLGFDDSAEFLASGSADGTIAVRRCGCCLDKCGAMAHGPAGYY